MIYTYAYPRPSVTVDIIIISENKDYILLIERGNEPFKNQWALPGGFVDMDEDIEISAYRELKEETSISDIELDQFRAYGKPGRDPRGRTISIVYFGILKNDQQDIAAGDDAKNLQWFNINKLPELAFDHSQIISDFKQKKLL
ncbi:MAG: NUDIX hydrolase [Bacteroidetes bacterium]|nr:NUDIX hydrolase [Bacteroidota bacterium]